jgi:hypothetical protein
MNYRGRDLLSAEARFLADYCGEDAVRRWHARLSDVERLQLGASVVFVEELCRSLAGAIWHVVGSLIRVFGDVYAVLTGRAPE